MTGFGEKPNSVSISRNGGGNSQALSVCDVGLPSVQNVVRGQSIVQVEGAHRVSDGCGDERD